MKSNYQSEAREDADLVQLFALNDQPDPTVVAAIHTGLADLREQVGYKINLTGGAADSSVDQPPLSFEIKPVRSSRSTRQRWQVYRTLALVATLVVTLAGISFIVILASKSTNDPTAGAFIPTSTPKAVPTPVLTPSPVSLLKTGFEEPTLGDWGLSGNQFQNYEISLDPQVRYSGQASASLKSTTPTSTGFGILYKQLDLQSYQGKRLQFSAFVKTQNLSDWAGLYMQIVDANKKTVNFDSMQNRPIKGTQDWQNYSIVLDVPVESATLYIGLILQNKGQVWVDNMQLEVVGISIPTTGIGTPTPSGNK